MAPSCPCCRNRPVGISRSSQYAHCDITGNDICRSLRSPPGGIPYPSSLSVRSEEPGLQPGHHFKLKAQPYPEADLDRISRRRRLRQPDRRTLSMRASPVRAGTVLLGLYHLQCHRSARSCRDHSCSDHNPTAAKSRTESGYPSPADR